jgi:hypothetical protein
VPLVMVRLVSMVVVNVGVDMSVVVVVGRGSFVVVGRGSFFAERGGEERSLLRRTGEGERTFKGLCCGVGR